MLHSSPVVCCCFSASRQIAEHVLDLKRKQERIILMILTCRKLDGAQEYGKGGGKLCAKHVFVRLQEHWLAMCS